MRATLPRQFDTQPVPPLVPRGLSMRLSIGLMMDFSSTPRLVRLQLSHPGETGPGWSVATSPVSMDFATGVAIGALADGNAPSHAAVWRRVTLH